MEERTPAQDSMGMFDGGVTKLLGVDRDELEKIVAIGLGRGGWAVSGRSAWLCVGICGIAEGGIALLHRTLWIKHWHKPIALIP